jgi:hypothetical protein
MDPSTENVSFGSTYNGATSSIQHICFCELPMMVKTTHTKESFGRRFVGYENWKVSKLLVFFFFFLFLYFCGEYVIVIAYLYSILMWVCNSQSLLMMFTDNPFVYLYVTIMCFKFVNGLIFTCKVLVSDLCLFTEL